MFWEGMPPHLIPHLKTLHSLFQMTPHQKKKVNFQYPILDTNYFTPYITTDIVKLLCSHVIMIN